MVAPNPSCGFFLRIKPMVPMSSKPDQTIIPIHSLSSEERMQDRASLAKPFARLLSRCDKNLFFQNSGCKALSL